MPFWVNSSREFGSGSHSIFVSKLGPCSLDGWKSDYMARLRGSWLIGHSLPEVPQRSILGPVVLNSLSMMHRRQGGLLFSHLWMIPCSGDNWCASELGCCPEEPRQAGKTCQQELTDILWGQMSCLWEGRVFLTNPGWGQSGWVAALLRGPGEV